MPQVGCMAPATGMGVVGVASSRGQCQDLRFACAFLLARQLSTVCINVFG